MKEKDFCIIIKKDSDIDKLLLRILNYNSDIYIYYNTIITKYRKVSFKVIRAIINFIKENKIDLVLYSRSDYRSRVNLSISMLPRYLTTAEDLNSFIIVPNKNVVVLDTRDNIIILTENDKEYTVQFNSYFKLIKNISKKNVYAKM